MNAVIVQAKENQEPIYIAKLKARLVDLICSSKVINRVDGTRIIDGLFNEVSVKDITAELQFALKEYLLGKIGPK
jgi:hypothetical protein